MNVYKKIETARKILDNNYKNYDSFMIKQLKEVTDKAELTYNDLKIKRLRSKVAENSMKELISELGKYF